MASLSNNSGIKKKYSDLPATPPSSQNSYENALNDDNDDDNGDSYTSLVMRRPTHSRSSSADAEPTTTTSMMSDNGGGGGNHRRYNGNKNRNNNSAAAPAPPSRTLAGTLRGDGYGGGGGHGKRSSGRGGGGHGRRLTTSAAAAAAAADLIQSHNYEPDESEVWRAYVAHTHFQNRGQWWTTGKKRALKRWILTFLIGVMQALVAAMANFGAKTLAKYKFDHVYELLKTSSQRHNDAMSAASTDDLFQADALLTDDAYADSATNFSGGTSGGSSNEQSSSGPSGFGASAFLVYFLYQTFYVAMAALFVYVEPASGGSGIAEVKCFLNGIDLPRVVRVKTLFCKVIGVTFSVAAGLPIGMEGPMVHSGAAVAASISQGKTRLWGVLDTSFSKFSDFRNDREKRDFVACGVAAGVASAFGSPIGGVLFSLEEGASYWSTKLTWRAFFCAMTTLATLFWVRNIDTLWGQANFDKLFSFGEFNSLAGGSSNFSIWELLLFIVIGCLGGLIGAVFNAANEHLTLWRMKNVNHSKVRRFLEVLFVSATVTTVSFLMPIIWGRCTDLPTNMEDWSNQEINLVKSLVPFRCPEGQYNEVASLIFTEADVAIKQLFHFREAGAENVATLSSGALFLFFVPYISLAALTCGTAVPAGLFVPSLLSGAAFGRLFGHLLHKLDHTNGHFADSGTYALMGAASVMGGLTRMTISLTVMLLEATGDMQYVLPLMLTVMAARFVGNVFNEGLADIQIHLKNIPFLDADVPTIAERNEIVAGQVMSTEVKCLRPVERAGVVYDLLRSCNHGSFPIVDTASGGTLYGTASRNMLCTLLQRRAFGSPDVLDDDSEGPGGPQQQNLGPRRLSPLVQWDTIERAYPRYPTIDYIVMREADRNCWLDLRPYANTAPYTVNETASIQRTYRLFRTLGLRFLCVVNHNNQVVGIITRKDLLPEALTDSLLRGRNAHVNDEALVDREVI